MTGDESTDNAGQFIVRATDFLQDAVVELEVWRQNARTAEERQALHRVTALLGNAATELRLSGGARDPAQHDLHLMASSPAGHASRFGPASGRTP